ncbi:MAG TPA: DUF2272 domain-containing protein [Allosphingosinicella sp.]|nr:DUF2272 domain-containing protein [Allosphingosinicella sp.]
MSQFTQALANICLAEFARWDNGAGKETQGRNQTGIAKDFYLFVKEYWVSIGINNLTGRTIQGGIRPAWSSAFVSFCERKAGAGARFKYTQAHCHYIAEAMKAAAGQNPNYGYVAKRANAHKPQIGDIVCAGREYAKRYTYEQAELIYQADSFYPSHGDIVVDVTATHAIVIGGNVNDNVDRKKLPLDGSGFLKPRVAAGATFPWIAILHCRI